MKTDLSHEFYKFAHRRIPLYGVLVLLGLMLYTLGTSYSVTPSLISQGFGAGQWTIIITMAISSDMIAMEWRDHTMATLLYKTGNKSTIYLAKFLVLVVYSFILLIFGTLFSLPIKALLVGSKYSWQASFHGHSLLNALLLNMGGTMIYLLFIISLSLLLIVWLRSNATVIMIGLAIGFLGADLSSVTMSALAGLKSIWAWNPLNMINVITQLSDSGVASISHLTNSELIIANLVYVALFFWLGISLFKKRSI